MVHQYHFTCPFVYNFNSYNLYVKVLTEIGDEYYRYAASADHTEGKSASVIGERRKSRYTKCEDR